MRKLFIALTLLSAWLLFGQELDALIASHGSHILGLAQESLLKETKLNRLTWNNESHTQVRYSQKVSNEPFTFGGMQITEAVFNFSPQKKLLSMQISMYNRGDCGDWPKEKFSDAVKSLQGSILELTKVKVPENSTRKLGGENTQQMLCRTSGYDIALRWCTSDRGPEFITVNLEPRGAIQKLSLDIKTSVKANELVRNVQKEAHGVRWIDVPMVNQGDKGYCVVAVVERLMKYYNSSLDQHIIAQLMASDSSHGTDIRSGIAALKASEHKLRIRIKELYANKAFETVQNFEGMIGDYNKAAKKAGQQRIDLQEARKSGFQLASVLGKIDKETFIRMRQKERPGPERFFITVKDSIDRGVPLMWMVLILPGELREQPTASFHARLINGYNPYTKEIIYTDTWGPGHEKKSMKLEEAWAISNIILNIRPL
ncbi:MAG: hypothetical protein J5833_08965 [Victivallales bacterium]|nr:hypothetical protein [Victivallales bacterium]